MMSFILNSLEYLKNTLGMDSNSFYPLLIKVVITVASVGFGAWRILISSYAKIKERNARKMFELYSKSESDNFYCYVMLVEVLVLIISAFFVDLLNEVIAFCFLYERKLSLECEIIISGIISFGVSILTTRLMWMRKRLLGDRRGKRIVLFSMFLINMAIVCDLLSGRIKYLGTIFYVLYIVIEIIGLFHFMGRYIKYDFSSMKLHLNNGEIIVCKDIDKVVRKKDYISVELEGRNIILQYDKIWKVEYFGPPKIILKNFRTKICRSQIMSRFNFWLRK